MNIGYYFASFALTTALIYGGYKIAWVIYVMWCDRGKLWRVYYARCPITERRDVARSVLMTRSVALSYLSIFSDAMFIRQTEGFVKHNDINKDSLAQKINEFLLLN